MQMPEYAIKLNYTKAKIEDSRISQFWEKVKDYRLHLHKVVEDKNFDADEASLVLPVEPKVYEGAKIMADKYANSELKYIIVIGIGGSNLGTFALYEALIRKEFTQGSGEYPEILFLDTVSPELLKKIADLIQEEVENEEELVINVISKSGGTAETAANFERLYAELKTELPQLLKRVVCTTDKDSNLWKLAQEKGLDVLEIPKKVGGRYSVFSTVGLFPLLLAKLDVKQMLEGARLQLETLKEENWKDNHAFISAALLYSHYQDGIKINNNFFFNPELESTGKWYRQLMGESIGKQNDLDGKVVNAGITPLVTIGSTDLHSMAQLYFGGPRDKFTTIIHAHYKDEARLAELVMPQLVPIIEHRSLGQIMQAIVGGTKKAYEKNDLPYMEIELTKVDAKNLGALLQFKMLEMIYLAKLMNVNAFDQPNVEDYKTETKLLLQD